MDLFIPIWVLPIVLTAVIGLFASVWISNNTEHGSYFPDVFTPMIGMAFGVVAVLLVWCAFFAVMYFLK